MGRNGYLMRMVVAVQETTVPLSLKFTSEQRQASVGLIADFLADRPAGIRLKLLAFVTVIDLVSLARFGRGFQRLGLPYRRKVLEGFFDARVPIIRKGFWGLNTLTRMGVYGQPSVYPAIRYRLKELADG